MKNIVPDQEISCSNNNNSKKSVIVLAYPVKAAAVERQGLNPLSRDMACATKGNFSLRQRHLHTQTR